MRLFSFCHAWNASLCCDARDREARGLQAPQPARKGGLPVGAGRRRHRSGRDRDARCWRLSGSAVPFAPIILVLISRLLRLALPAGHGPALDCSGAASGPRHRADSGRSTRRNGRHRGRHRIADLLPQRCWHLGCRHSAPTPPTSSRSASAGLAVPTVPSASSAGRGRWLKRWLPAGRRGRRNWRSAVAADAPWRVRASSPFLIAAGSLALIAEPWIRGGQFPRARRTALVASSSRSRSRWFSCRSTAATSGRAPA